MAVKKVKSHWNEVWTKVETNHPTRGSDYFFSDYGRMKSINKRTEDEKLLKGSRDKYGNVRLSLQLAEGKRQQFYLHRLIGETYIEQDSTDHLFLIHIDNNKENNYWENILWVTQEQLTEHQRENGVFDLNNRKRDPNYKMTEVKVRLLKKRLAKGKTKREILARDFGISVEHVKLIEKGKRWGHVTI